MRLPSTFIFSFLIIGFFRGFLSEIHAAFLWPPDSIQSVSVDSISKIRNPVLQSAEIYTDYLKLLALPLPSEDKVEMGFGITSGFFTGLNLETGYGNIITGKAYSNAEYQSTGYYGRIGLNVIYEYNPNVFLYTGIKYGGSRFMDKTTFSIESTMWDDYKETIVRSDLTAGWFEIIAGSESGWKNNIYLGFIFRFKILLDYPQMDDFDVYYIPGYGRTLYNTLIIVNLYVKYRIPISK